MSGGLTETADGNLEANEASKTKYELFSRVRLFATLWTVARQVPLPMGFPRPKHWRGLPFPSPGKQMLNSC